MDAEKQNMANLGQAQNSAGGECKKCKCLPVIIVLAILAVGGIGFGGYELWVNAQRDEEIANLQSENEQKTQTIDEMTKSIEEADELTQEIKSDEVDGSNKEENGGTQKTEIVITGLGKVCVADMTQNEIVTCAEDIEDISEFVSCDSNEDVLMCSVGNTTQYTKFVYNLKDGTFTHGQLMEK